MRREQRQLGPAAGDPFYESGNVCQRSGFVLDRDLHDSPKPGRPDRCTDGGQRESWLVAFLAQVCEEHPPEFGVHDLTCQLSGQVVRQVTAASSDPLLQGPGVGSLAQPDFVVIRLQDQVVAAGQRRTHRGSRAPEIRRHARLQSAAGLRDRDRDRIRRIVTGGNGMNFEIADPEAGLRREDLHLLASAQQVAAGSGGAGGHEQRPAPAPGGDSDPCRMVPMLVGDDDRVHPGWIPVE